jgi:hypothetical protein
VATAGDPAKNTVAVNNYLTIAVAGVARVSQQLRQDSVYGSPNNVNKPKMSASAGQAIVTQQEIRDKLLSKDVGLNVNQIEALKKQDPAAKQAMAKLFGITA